MTGWGGYHSPQERHVQVEPPLHRESSLAPPREGWLETTQWGWSRAGSPLGPLKKEKLQREIIYPLPSRAQVPTVPPEGGGRPGHGNYRPARGHEVCCDRAQVKPAPGPGPVQAHGVGCLPSWHPGPVSRTPSLCPTPQACAQHLESVPSTPSLSQHPRACPLPVLTPPPRSSTSVAFLFSGCGRQLRSVPAGGCLQNEDTAGEE